MAYAVDGDRTVVHCAARVHQLHDRAEDPPAEYRRVNRDGTARLARQAAAAGVPAWSSSARSTSTGADVRAAVPADDPPRRIRRTRCASARPSWSRAVGADQDSRSWSCGRRSSTGRGCEPTSRQLVRCRPSRPASAARGVRQPSQPGGPRQPGRPDRVATRSPGGRGPGRSWSATAKTCRPPSCCVARRAALGGRRGCFPCRQALLGRSRSVGAPARPAPVRIARGRHRPDLRAAGWPPPVSVDARARGDRREHFLGRGGSRTAARVTIAARCHFPA